MKTTNFVNISVLIIFMCFVVSCFKVFYDKILYFFNSTLVYSNIDNNYYRVRNTKNKQETADVLALINSRIEKLLNYLSDVNEFTENIDLLIKRYDKDNLVENISLDNTTYTINKGDNVSVCLTTRDTDEKIYDINSLMFVIIHELTHIGCKSYGHNKEFKNFFEFLLQKAIEIKIYNYVDYYSNPQEYCGIEINSTPLKKPMF